MGLRALLLACVPALYCQAAEMPFPVLFLHGLTGGQQTFDGCLAGLQQTFDVPPPVVFHVCLNHDADLGRAAMDSTDMVPIGFTAYGSNTLITPDPSTRLFVLNFNDDEFAGVGGHPDHNGSNQSAITKQGLALAWATEQAKQVTGSERVILVGHSMGGLAIREYLQRTDSNGDPRWWLDPLDPQGHSALRVVTTGCPHLGSNSGLDDPTLLADGSRDSTPDVHRDALRDLRYSYDSYPGCPGDPYPAGLYLFGGDEACLIAPGGYDNADVDCDGSADDTVIGLSSGTGDNPLMPLPATGLDYVWITNNSRMGEDYLRLLFCTQSNALRGDGSVLTDRQWLYDGSGQPLPAGAADTLLTADRHTDADLFGCSILHEGADTHALLRGLDEPGSAAAAWPLALGRVIQGCITRPAGEPASTTDEDWFRIGLAQPGILHLHLPLPGDATSLALADASGAPIAVDGSGPEYDLELALAAGAYTLRVSGPGTASSWTRHYELATSVSPLPQPLPVTDLTLEAPDSTTLLLGWSPVVEDVLGHPLPCVLYHIYRSDVPGFVPSPTTWLSATGSTSAALAVDSAQGFFRVTAEACVTR